MKDEKITQEPEKIKTEFEDIYADDVVRQGKNEFPVFDVSKEEFMGNGSWDRKRIRFKSGSNVQKYLQNGKYNRPFYIRWGDDSGKKWTRRIK
jgi:hypothetical protein